MSALPGPASEATAEYLDQVCAVMVSELGLDQDEAEGRIATAMGSWDLESEETENILGHEEPEYWARWIYYGADVEWWLQDERELKPRPWP